MAAPAVLAPGQPFPKGWRFRNVGTCAWDSSFALAYASDSDPAAQMNGQPIPVVGSVAPGQEAAFWVNLVAPLTPGVYQGFWAMRNGQGGGFGDRTWVGIQVVDPTIPTPTATPNAASFGEFYADRTTVRVGECTTFRWRVENVVAVYFYALGEDWQRQGVSGIDHGRVAPSSPPPLNCA